MRYIRAKYESYERDMVYRIYISDSLKNLVGLNVRYIDFFTPKETRTAKDIIADIRGKF